MLSRSGCVLVFEAKYGWVFLKVTANTYFSSTGRAADRGTVHRQA